MATSTLHTIESASRELNLSGWQAKRAIARGILTASQVGGGQFRITPEAVVKAAASDDLEGPPIARGWLDVQAESFRASSFVSQVRQEIRLAIPETDPGEDQMVSVTPSIRRIANSEPAPLKVIFHGRRRLPYSTLAEVHAASSLADLVKHQVQKSAGRVGLTVPNALDRLYSSPENYKRFVDAAWAEYLQAGISERQSFLGVPGRPAMRRFTLRNNQLQVSKERILNAAF